MAVDMTEEARSAVHKASTAGRGDGHGPSDSALAALEAVRAADTGASVPGPEARGTVVRVFEIVLGEVPEPEHEDSDSDASSVASRIPAAPELRLLRSFSLFGDAHGVVDLPALPEQAITALSVAEDMSTLAIGCASGGLIVLRGHFSRERAAVRGMYVSPQALHAAAGSAGPGKPDSGEAPGQEVDAVTSLAFATSSQRVRASLVGRLKRVAGAAAAVLSRDASAGVAGDAVWSLLTTTRKRVLSLVIAPGPELRIIDSMTLDDLQGAAPGCAALAPGKGGQLAVARDEGVFMFTGEERGSAVAIADPKLHAAWFRDMLVLVTSEGPRRQTVAVYDLQLKLVAFRYSLSPFDAPAAASLVSHVQHRPTVDRGSALGSVPAVASSVAGVRFVLAEWGQLWVVTGSGCVLRFTEKSANAKLDLLFQTNSFPVALRLAAAAGYDRAALMEIFRNYGDYLYKRGDTAAAMTQYIRTIEYLEPSYVIRLYLDAPRVPQLTQYLEALHAAGKASAGHTTLLLNSYIAMGDVNKLRSFLAGDAATTYRVQDAVTGILSRADIERLFPTPGPEPYHAAHGPHARDRDAPEDRPATAEWPGPVVPEPAFDVDSAIAALRGANLLREAAYLAGAHGRASSFIELMLDLHSARMAGADDEPGDLAATPLSAEHFLIWDSLDLPQVALDYISVLPFLSAEHVLQRYGARLVESHNDFPVDFLVRMCTSRERKLFAQGTLLPSFMAVPELDSTGVQLAVRRVLRRPSAASARAAADAAAAEAKPAASRRASLSVRGLAVRGMSVASGSSTARAPSGPAEMSAPTVPTPSVPDQPAMSVVDSITLATSAALAMLASEPELTSQFLTAMISTKPAKLSTAGAWHTLLDLSLRAAAQTGDGDELSVAGLEDQLRQPVLVGLLQHPKAVLDNTTVLSLCQRYHYLDGVLWVYQRLGAHSAAMERLVASAVSALEHGDGDQCVNFHERALELARTRGAAHPALWCSLLEHFAQVWQNIAPARFTWEGSAEPAAPRRARIAEPAAGSDLALATAAARGSSSAAAAAATPAPGGADGNQPELAAANAAWQAQQEAHIAVALDAVESAGLLSPLEILAIFAKNAEAPMRLIQKYLLRELKQEAYATAAARKELESLKGAAAEDRAQAQRLKEEAYDIRTGGSRALNEIEARYKARSKHADGSMDLPSTRLSSTAGDAWASLEVTADDEFILERRQRQLDSAHDTAALAERFTQDLDSAKDGFSAAIGYLRDGLFDDAVLAPHLAS